jgi:hypothetical protein
MKRYEIWNGETPINNIPAIDVLNGSDEIKRNLHDIFYTVDEYGVANEICIGLNIKSTYKMPIEYTLEQVAQAYVDNLNIGGTGSMPIENMNLIKEQADKISILNEQSSKLLLDNAKKEVEINTLNKNLSSMTLEVAKIKGGM